MLRDSNESLAMTKGNTLTTSHDDLLTHDSTTTESRNDKLHSPLSFSLLVVQMDIKLQDF
ncbi:hypothetical protein [Helicobacter sp. MIT 05-5294]|uniref:hypothetical protein n=1 Tax=Helicobacter sp. MIT 05-5294 TaxID=1548150 RepID=UPI0010FD3595|nr:hypothetical protein [Helicobacter sp. MIT 05-5294]TLD86306.1 hypothetical protein LS69_006330 [Helicobacter sp. MIT 05-5294]